MSVVVFIGPSLPVDVARAILTADYRPPVRCGDVLRAVDDGATAIAIIDGLFEQVATVRHKEILYALSQGIAVYGGASMGALRAAETAVFGTIGVGQVFERFRDGIYEDDDEVAVSHASADYDFRPLSEAMVNIRWGLENALAQAAISTSTHDILVQLAKDMFYPDRNWPALWRQARAVHLTSSQVDGAEHHVAVTRPNVKADDARALLLRMRTDAEKSEVSHCPRFDFLATRPFLADLRRATIGPGNLESPVVEGVTAAALALYARVWDDLDRTATQAALLARLTGAHTEPMPTSWWQGPSRHAAGRRSGASGGARRNPAVEVGICWEEHADATRRWDRDQMDGTGASLTDGYFPVAALTNPLVARMLDSLTERTRAWPSAPSPTDVDEPSLLTWYQEKTGRRESSVLDHCRKLGIRDPDAFLAELTAEHLYETSQDETTGGP
ncbi:MAG: hypothetical protein QOH84_624 [Kribbellaceae bacterium]|jgi:hypothetical protein|nr:hypothetical protein [Kribbellaceae bacterium]